MLMPLAYNDSDGMTATLAPGRASVFPGAAQPPLQLSLELPPRVRAGDPIPMRLVLRNHGFRAETVDLGEPLTFDIVVFSLDGLEVWSRFETVFQPRILQTHAIGAGKSLVFVDAWKQRTNEGCPVAPGTYMVQGILPVAGVPGGWGTDLYMIAILP